ncbi:MAG: hypothetical protein ACMG6S_29680 [Byssovorax sp.]
MRSLSATILVPLGLFAPLLLVSACSDDTGSTGGSTGTTTTTVTSSTGTGGAGGAEVTSSASSSATASSSGTGGDGGAGGSGPKMVDEKLLDVKLTLTGTDLTIVVKDGAAPVMTDAWLYTLEGGKLVPLVSFGDPVEKRRYRGLMMPCTLAGQPSGLTPCFKGELNGVMTDVKRSNRVNGVLESAIDGTVIVPLMAAPVNPIVVVVGVEDQRYAGVAAIDIAGVSIAAPAGVGVPEKHVERTYANDVGPIVKTYCVSCHGKDGTVPYMKMDTYDQLANTNFGLDNKIIECDTQFPNDPAANKTCVDAITAVEFYFEAGVPAASPGARRLRPDELKSVSPEGLLWYGSGGSRFGAKGDRRMPPQNTTPDLADDKPDPIYFDKVPGDYQIIFDWVAQGMKP